VAATKKKKAFTYPYPRPSLTVDIALVTREASSRVLLIQRKADPFKGKWALPGGFVDVDWDWSVCHNYYAMTRGVPPQIVGLKVQDGAIGGSWRLVAGEDTNVTCRFLGCPRP